MGSKGELSIPCIRTEVTMKLQVEKTAIHFLYNCPQSNATQNNTAHFSKTRSSTIK